MSWQDSPHLQLQSHCNCNANFAANLLVQDENKNQRTDTVSLRLMLAEQC